MTNYVFAAQYTPQTPWETSNKDAVAIADWLKNAALCQEEFPYRVFIFDIHGTPREVQVIQSQSPYDEHDWAYVTVKFVIGAPCGDVLLDTAMYRVDGRA